MSRLSLSYKGKRRPTDLNVLCFSFLNIWYWVMSELNALDITSQPCDIGHSVETSTFWLVSVDEWVDGCGHEELETKLLFSGPRAPIVSITQHNQPECSWVNWAVITVQIWSNIWSSICDDMVFKFLFRFWLHVETGAIVKWGLSCTVKITICGERSESIRRRTANHLWLLLSGGLVCHHLNKTILLFNYLNFILVQV